MYFNQLLGAVRTLKLVETFFQPFFNLFCSFQSFFSDFTAEITKKREKMNKKKTCFCLLLKVGRHAKAGGFPEGVPPICLISVDF